MSDTARIESSGRRPEQIRADSGVLATDPRFEITGDSGIRELRSE
jgi:hypothetical protein